MQIEFLIHPTATTTNEASVVELVGPTFRNELDMDFTPLRRMLRNFDPIGLDLLMIATCVYGVDKAVSRWKESDDGWTRNLNVTIPVQNPLLWTQAEQNLCECLDFLTGDRWEFKFVRAQRDLYQPKKRKRRVRWHRIQGSAMSLFSGGLDSYIGTIDHLETRPGECIGLVSHYEKHVAGPASDQDHLIQFLHGKYPGRITHLQCRIGLTKPGDEHSYRSRSFLFLALATLSAASLSHDTPIIIPENGPIALNYPLTPSRRGSCSTRTAHPYFIKSFQNFLSAVGLRHSVSNPYIFSTKGEMIVSCKRQDLLKQCFALSRSCAKFGHKSHWSQKNARQCGVCVPCIFRRAALHKVGLDSEVFGIDLSSEISSSRYETDAYADIRALTAFVQRNDSPHEVRRELLSNGPLDAGQVEGAVDLVGRVRGEVRDWLAVQTCNTIKAQAGLIPL